MRRTWSMMVLWFVLGSILHPQAIPMIAEIPILKNIPEQRISVLDFSAVPDDGKDDAPAVRAAIESMRTMKNPVLVFPKGRFHFSAPSDDPLWFMNISNISAITIRGDNTEFIGTVWRGMLRFICCGSIDMAGIIFDHDPPPITAGKILSVNDSGIDIEIVPEYPLFDGKPIQNITVYDPVRRVPVIGAGEYKFTHKLAKKNTVLKKGRILTIPIEWGSAELASADMKAKRPGVGSHVAGWYSIRAGAAIAFRGCGAVSISNCIVYTSPSMGITQNACRRVLLSHCSVMPRDGRWVSTPVDATHFNMIRESVTISDCVFERMGDDAGNVHGMYKIVHEIIDPHTLVVKGKRSMFHAPIPGKAEELSPTAEYSLYPGDTVEFGTKENPLVAGYTSTIRESVPVAYGDVALRKITLNHPIPDFVTVNSSFGVKDEAPPTIIRNTTVRGGRSLGFRMKTRDLIIENCLFEDLPGSGIWITCSIDEDLESIAASNVMIRSTIFRRCGSAAINSTAGRTAKFPEVFTDVQITDNRIEQMSRPAFRLSSMKSLLISNNYIETESTDEMTFPMSTDVVVANNTFKRITAGDLVPNGSGTIRTIGFHEVFKPASYTTGSSKSAAITFTQNGDDRQKGTYHIKAEFPKGAENVFAYPGMNFEPPIDLQGYSGIRLHITPVFGKAVAKEEYARTFMKLQLVERSGKAWYFHSGRPYPLESGTLDYFFHEFKEAPWGPKDANGKLDINEITHIKVGYNSDKMNCEYTLSTIDLIIRR